MTRVLVDARIVGEARDGNDGSPGRGERRRILDRDLVLERLCIDPREPLDEMQRLGRPRPDAGPFVVRPVEKVDRIDDERVGLPTANGIAEPLPDVAVWTPVGRN